MDFNEKLFSPSLNNYGSLANSNANIIDLRNEQSYNNNHIDGGINIPHNKLIANQKIYTNNIIFSKIKSCCKKKFIYIAFNKILYVFLIQQLNVFKLI